MELVLNSLNEKQRESAIFDYTKALQIVAGPGTGKTKVLTTRVAYLLLEKGINPSDVVITTFTKKATLEMIERISFLLEGTGINPKSLWIGTFHSICARVLRQHGWRIGLPKDWRTFSDSDTDPIISTLVEKIPDQIRDFAHSYTRKVNLLRPNSKRDWAVHPAAVKKMISWLKSEGVTADEYRARNDHDPALLHFYDQYQAELKSQHALDFDDLLLSAFKLLSKQRCLPNIKHVLVDEFQDTNSIQLNLMYLFARGNSSQSQGITAVGDPDQSIYAFRNALAGNFTDMITHCPIPCSRIVLVENYRSSQKILTTSEMLIKQQQTGREDRLPLRAQFDSDFPPVYIEFPAKFLESRALAKELIYLRSLPNLWNYNDFALLVRHRRQIRPLETSLIEHRIPYKIVNGRAFWELKEINGMMDLLKCVYSNFEKNAILRALQYPARGMGSATAKKLEIMFVDYRSPFEALSDIMNGPQKNTLPPKAVTVINNFISLIEKCRDLLTDATGVEIISSIFDQLYEESGLRYEYQYVDGKKKAEVNPKGEPDLMNKRHLNILILREHVANFKPMEEDLAQRDGPVDENPESDKYVNIHDLLREFIDSVNLYSTETEVDESQMSKKQIQQKKKREEEGFVTISTIHGAKGLEWPVVMIPGCVEGVIPCVFSNKEDTDDSENETDSGTSKTTAANNSPRKMRQKNSEGSLDEERRMFFVAQTRAKHLLYLTSTLSNDSESRYESSTPSRFLTADLVSTMCQEQKLFGDVKSIEKLYRAVGKSLPSGNPAFSTDVLIKDYEMFINNRRERMIWRGSTVFDPARLKLSENTNQPPANYGITTAAMQLKNTPTNIRGPPHYSQKLALPNSAARTSSDPSALTARNMAPNYGLARSNSIGAPKNYAPKATLHKVTKTPQASSFAPKAGEAIKFNENKRDVSPEKVINKESITKAPFATSNNMSSANKRTGRRSRRKIVADSIDLRGMQCDYDSSVIKGEVVDFNVKREEPVFDNACNKTAGELLHDSNDLRNDSRPILTNAKSLADSISKPAGKRIKRPDDSTKKKVKLEPLSSRPDIMSRLSQAKKRADESKDTVIIID
ncbi:LANO_0D08438g1_1 [Lachancea nothofagi CBS 11611]|uniref:DNA 3'-5' helicase n=1 Tax=Lachancea nothofagi CBS 11611 TaxID=1266666 RepID=A0A1G4JJI6_9SACH|nr:LANO_0D08438g1_1 [Lachancea nothofagi CBS 11611]